VSVNLEAPTAQRLQYLTREKGFERDLLQPMRWAKQFRDRHLGAEAGITTQFVIGAAGEPDKEILTTVERLYREFSLARPYFSAFQPVPDTPLEGLRPTAPLREHRLYQSDFLLRRYGFSFEELVFDPSGNLPRSADPKLAWARAHPEFFPIEVNRASREQLLRIPGIGPRGAGRILQLRKQRRFHELDDLRAAGVVSARAAPFIMLDGRRAPEQLTLPYMPY
jgi:predicted DNA-binding helix-hairpin-helix protein